MTLKSCKHHSCQPNQSCKNIELSIGCVDLFCGLGGLTHGLMRSGIDVVGGVDIDPKCRFPYEANNNAIFFQKDIKELSKSELNAMFADAKPRLLAGCAPCQPFSKYNRRKNEGGKGKKWDILSDFGRLIRECKPELVTMENVPQLVNHEVFDDFLKSLEGYFIWWKVVDCYQYGVPQTRNRLVLFASRFSKLELLPPASFNKCNQTVRSAISHLPPLEAGCSDSIDALHTASSLSDLNLRRIRASKPGGTWRDWDESLIAKCHQKGSGQTYSSVYGRMQWDKPAPTVTTQCFGFGNGRFGHPDQDRAISLREAAILQTFPDNYRFLGPGERVHFSILGRLIGNAVPVRLGEVIGESIIKHLSDQQKS